MSLLPFYEWIDSTSLSKFLQASTYTFPVVEVLHLVGLTIFLGAAVLVSLRLIGLGLKEPASLIQQGIGAWTWVGFLLVGITGAILLIAEPIKLAHNAAFPIKLALLGAGTILHFAGYLVLLRPGRVEAFPIVSKIVAILVLVCWFGAGVAGRAIGFV